jgi:hypothetical protein
VTSDTVQVLPLGQTEERRGAGAEPRRSQSTTAGTSLDRDREPASQASIRAASGRIAGEQLRRSQLVRRRTTASGRRVGSKSKQAGDEGEVRKRVAGERAGLRVERDELGVEPAAAILLGDLGRRAGAERGGVVDQARARAKLLHVDLGLEVGRSEVAVDEPRDVLVEAKHEEQVVAGDTSSGRGTRACHPRGDARRVAHRRAFIAGASPAGARGTVGIVILVRAARLAGASAQGSSSRVGSTGRPAPRSAGRRWSPRRRRPRQRRPAPRPSLVRGNAARLAAERHPLPLDRVEAHPQGGGLLARHLTDVGRLLVGRQRPAADDPLRLPDHSQARW